MILPLISGLALAFLCGLLVGSFLNVCIHRWPRGESVVRPRSRCPTCKKTIPWYDNVPVLSYLMLKGCCRYCQAAIAPHYPVVELLNGLFYAFIYWGYGVDPMAWKLALFVSMMLVLVVTDWREYILPDELTIGGLIIGWAISPFVYLDGEASRLFLIILEKQYSPGLVSVLESFAASLLIAGFLFLMGEAYYRLRHVEGLGFGDVKMVAMIGAFWGFGDTLLTLIVGSLLGSVVGIAMVLLARKGWGHALPFGAYLGATAIVVALWGDDILSWYFQDFS